MTKLATINELAAHRGWHPQDIKDHVWAGELRVHGKTVKRGDVHFIPSALMRFEPDVTGNIFGQEGEPLPSLRGYVESVFVAKFADTDRRNSAHTFDTMVRMYASAAADDPSDIDAKARLETLETLRPLIFGGE